MDGEADYVIWEKCDTGRNFENENADRVNEDNDLHSRNSSPERSHSPDLDYSQIENRFEKQMTDMAKQVQETVNNLLDIMKQNTDALKSEMHGLKTRVDDITQTQENVRVVNTNKEPENRFYSRPENEGQNRNFNQNKGGNSGLRMKPQSYSGDEDLSDFLAQFQITAEINRWDYYEKSLYLANALTGGARSLLSELNGDDRRDYHTLVEKLETRYGVTNRAEVFRTQLKTRVRGKGETIPELAQSIKKMTRQAYPGANQEIIEALALDNFIDAITDSDIRLRLKETGPKSISEAEKIAVRLEAHRVADRQRVRLVGAVEEHNVRPSGRTNERSMNDALTELRKQVENLTETVNRKEKFSQDRNSWHPRENYYTTNRQNFPPKRNTGFVPRQVQNDTRNRNKLFERYRQNFAPQNTVNTKIFDQGEVTFKAGEIIFNKDGAKCKQALEMRSIRAVRQ